MSENTTKIVFGAIKSIPDVRNYKIKVDDNEVFPDEFELKMIRVKDQGQTNSCVGHSLSEIIEYHNAKQNNDDTEMSPGWIYGNRKTSFNKRKGLLINDAIDSVRKYGDVPQKLFPSTADVPDIINEFDLWYDTLKEQAMYCRFSGYYGVFTINEIKKALMVDGPVVFAIKWFDDITVKNGILTSSCKGKCSGFHCMVIYGWNKDGFKILNSWGKYWGNKGTAIMPFDFPICEAYGITDDILDKRTDIIKPYSENKFKAFLAKIINIFAWLGYQIGKIFHRA